MANKIGILGKKIGMTRVYNEFGRSIPVTVIEAGPCTILQIKTCAKEGYNAIQVGFSEKKESRCNKPIQGHCKRADSGTFSYIKEFRVEDISVFSIGQTISLPDILKIGDTVDIRGTSKGRGFQGVIKRHGFHGGRETHGSNFHRAPGSIGASAWPSRVVKGRKMPGRMGNDTVSVKNLKIVDIRHLENLVLISGSIPGAINSLVTIRNI